MAIWVQFAVLTALALPLILTSVSADIVDDVLGLNVTFDPAEVDQLAEENIVTVTLNYSLLFDKAVLLRARSADTDIAVVYGPREITLQPSPDNNFTHSDGIVQVKGIFLGRTKLYFSAWINSSTGHSGVQNGSLAEGWRELSTGYHVTVIREDGPLNTAFLVSVILLVVLANAAMGCKVEIPVVKEILKKPVAPVVGILSQFIIMPLLGLGAAYAFQFDPGTALGLFATGCAPGGGASNAYTFLLDGDVSLSVTMTLVSTLASFGMIPLWLFTVGTQVLYKDAGVKIPFENIFTSLAGLILPVLLGMLIKWKRPQWVKYILKAVTPLMVIILVVILSVGIYANLYIFKLLRPEVLAAGAILPNCGFILGGLAALATRQPWQRVKTIAVETGLQNTGVPIVLLQLSLPKPDSDFAIVAPIASALFTPILLWIWILARVIKKRCCHKPQSGDMTKTTDEEGVDLTGSPVKDQTDLHTSSQSPPSSPGH